MSGTAALVAYAWRHFLKIERKKNEKIKKIIANNNLNNYEKVCVTSQIISLIRRTNFFSNLRSFQFNKTISPHEPIQLLCTQIRDQKCETICATTKEYHQFCQIVPKARTEWTACNGMEWKSTSWLSHRFFFRSIRSILCVPVYCRLCAYFCNIIFSCLFAFLYAQICTW